MGNKCDLTAKRAVEYIKLKVRDLLIEWKMNAIDLGIRRIVEYAILGNIGEELNQCRAGVHDYGHGNQVSYGIGYARTGG